MPLHGEGSMRAAFERRAEYFRLRRAGVKAGEAAYQLGLDWRTGSRYERWFEAIEAGQIAEPVWGQKIRQVKRREKET